jgi:hypothetical protein
MRMTHGSQVNTSKLSATQVMMIRRRFAAGETNRSALALEYGVSNPNVSAIVRGVIWKHLPVLASPPGSLGQGVQPKNIRTLREWRAQGLA